MKIFSSCSGDCCICACGGCCYAGNGDNDFSIASREQIIERLKANKYPDFRQKMLDYVGMTEEEINNEKE